LNAEIPAFEFCKFAELLIPLTRAGVSSKPLSPFKKHIMRRITMKTSFAKQRIKGCLPLCFLSMLLFAAPVFAQPQLNEISTHVCRNAVEAARATREKAEAGDAQAQYALGLLFQTAVAGKHAGEETAPQPDEFGEFPDLGENASQDGEFADLKRLTALLARGWFFETPEVAEWVTPFAQILMGGVIEPMAKELGVSPELPELKAEEMTEYARKETMARAMAFLRKSGQADWITIALRPILYAMSCPFALRFGNNDFEAIYWFRRAAEQGLPQAQVALGEAMLLNAGIKRFEAWNKAVAIRWFLKARAGGFAIAPDSEAGKLLAEYDQMQDFQKAAETGDGAAAYALAYAHEQLSRATGVTDAEKHAHREQTAKWLHFAVAKDVPKAKLWLARVYLGYGDVEGIPKRPAEGLEMLRSLAETDDAEAQALLARLAQKPAERVAWLRRAAEGNFIEAQKDLALAYERGDGVAQDMEKALFWMRRAAAQDNSDAKGWLKEFDKRATLAQAAKGKGSYARETQYDLARAYLPYDGSSFWETSFSGKAIYLSPDPDKAAEAFRRFLAARHVARMDKTQRQQMERWRKTAQTFLAAHERATKKLRLLKQKARAGDARAQVELGKRYQHVYSKDAEPFFDRIKEDQEAAFHWFSAAAQAGDTEAQYLLGEWFIKNRHDREAARPWLEKAVAQETEWRAAYSEAGVLLNRLSAFAAAEKGDAAAQYALAHFYGQGKDYSSLLGGVGMVERDLGKMLDWMHRAAEGGYPPAQCELGALYAWPGFARMNLETSAHWLHEAAKARHPLAQYLYGKARYFGRGAPADEEEGRKWLEAAARAAEMSDETGRLKSVFDEETGQPRPEFAWLNLGAAGTVKRDDPGAQILMWLHGVNPYHVMMPNPLTGAFLAKTFLQNLDQRAALEKLAAAGDADAQFTLGILLYHEQLSPPLRGGIFCMGCEADRYLPEEVAMFAKQGVTRLRQAEKAGHPQARRALRRIEIGDPRGDEDDLAMAKKVLCQRALLPDACEPREEAAEAEALQALRQAARTGDAQAVFRLGEALYIEYDYAHDWDGNYFGPDLTRAEEARSLLLASARAGIFRAYCRLAQSYWKEDNTVEALSWFLKAQPEMSVDWLSARDCPDETRQSQEEAE
jgi:TPR repeat protein